MPERPIADEPASIELVGRTVVHRSYVWDIVDDEVRLAGQSSQFQREYVDHPGAVAVVAVDEEDRVLLISQQRVPVRHRLWELPAGLLDIDGEDPATAARRELEEETDHTCARLDHLIDVFTTPGGSSESIRIFLGRGITPLPPEARIEREDEEADIVLARVPFEEAIEAILDNRLHNGPLVSGLLAASRHRSEGYAALRAADAPWPTRRTRGA